tara:strand:+ start:1181 stop:1306 length:126 start_codon:yes stop_codon:yes gene_type:complete
MVYGFAAPCHIFWGLAFISFTNFMKLKKNNSLGGWLRETVI